MTPPIPAGDHSPALVEKTILPWEGDGRLYFWCSIPSDTMANKMARYNAREGECLDMDSQINREIVIRDLLLEEIIVTEESGEQKKLLRAVLILQDGLQVGTTSKGVVGCLQSACEEFGPPPWSAGLRFTVISKQIDPSRRTFKLIPAFVEIQAKGAKK